MKKNLIKSLKELLEALGGETSDKNTLVGVIDDITNQVTENKEEEKEEDSDESNDTLFITGITDGTNVTMDKTWNEIKEAFAAGKTLLYAHDDQQTDEYFRLSTVVFIYGSAGTNEYSVSVYSGTTLEQYQTTSTDGYPSYNYD